MIGPELVRDKAKRSFGKAIMAWLAGEIESFFPYRIPANLTPSKDQSKAIAEVESLRDHSKQAVGVGYRIDWKSRRSRTHGLNDFPHAIFVDTMDDLAHLSDRVGDWETLQSATEILRTRQPAFENWLRKGPNWKTLLQLSDVLSDLLSILDYFIEHPRPDCFARELPVAVSTKLIEQHRRRLSSWLDLLLPPEAIDFRFGHDQFEPRYGLRYARPHYLLRVLDEDLRHELGLPFDELSLPAESIDKLSARDQRVIIVENKVSLLSLPPMTRTLALGGLGNGVTQLSDISWLPACNVIYWGDLDADGFRILDRLRAVLPHVESRLMEQAVVDQFCHLATDGNGDQPHETENLCESELRCYHFLCQRNLRIEQEHLPNELIQKALSR
ncbi:MAG: Wadjet anti-phage system protein JetD domain-containing protein [Pirellulaceae bacterium]